MWKTILYEKSCAHSHQNPKTSDPIHAQNNDNEECRTREENNKRRQQGKPSNYQGKNNGVRNNGPHLNQKHLSESGEPKDVSSLRAANN